MSNPLQGRTALVTGGGVRIGAAICRALGAAGTRVVVHHRHSVGAARDVARSIVRAGGDAATVRGRLDRESDCERLLRRASDIAGPLDILVNNASVFRKQPLAGITETALLAEFRPNLFAPVLLTRAFAAQAKTGDVINLLDSRIRAADPSCIPYLLSKKALAAFTESAALALAPRIRVNAVAPGPVLPPPGRPASYLKGRAGRVPLGRLPTPESVAAAVLFLLAAPDVTGQIVFVAGGQHLLSDGV